MKKLISLIGFALLVFSSRAQETVSGKVENENGETIGGATVVFRHNAKKQTQVSDEQGGFAFNGLARGKYNLLITAVGYEPHQTVIVLHYSGDKVPWFTRDFKVPAYTLLDAAVYYSPGKGNMQLSANLNNVLDKTYWLGAQNYLRLFPGAPGNLMVTATYRF